MLIILSYFTSKEDLTSYSPRDKISFDVSLFENEISSVISDLESVFYADCEEPLRSNNIEEPNLSIKLTLSF